MLLGIQSFNNSFETLCVMQGLPRYKELLSAIQEHDRLLEDGTLGLQHCMVGSPCSLPDDKKYSGHMPLRHRPCQLQVRTPSLADQHMDISQMSASKACNASA